MKNPPARLRPKLRARSNYSRADKCPYLYPAWVRDGAQPPTAIFNSLRLNWRQHSNMPLPEGLR